MSKHESTLIGMQMKRIRTERGWSQMKVCENWPGSVNDGKRIICAVDRTVYAKYESGQLTPSDKRIEEFASIFRINPDTLRHMYQSTAIAIPDTSALLNNSMLLEMMMEDFDQVVIAKTVQLELSAMKGDNGNINKADKTNKKKASQIIGRINELFEQQETEKKENDNDNYKPKLRKEDNESLEVFGDSRISLNDRKLIALAQKLAKRTSRKVFIIHYDKDIPFFSDDTISNITVKDYIVKRDKTPDGYQMLLDFDEEFRNFNFYEKFFETLEKDAIDSYLPNGMTLLISCINCNAPNRIQERNPQRKIPDSAIIAKVDFLIRHGANLNKTDNSRYCHTPLEHCISAGFRESYPFEVFKKLIDAGADYNKGSIDETKKRSLRISEKNEGNTPLMKACWEGKLKFFYELLDKPDLSINQQDCNGYTALIKCAVKRYDQIKKEKPFDYYEKMYHALIEHGADTRIRDRNNLTAQDWWNKGDNLKIEEE